MKIKDGFHPAHYDAVNIESQVKHLRAENLGKGATKKIYAFPNGYGASVINGSMSFGKDEVAVISFENPVKFYKSRKKRFRKKLLKKLGTYQVISGGVNRYDDHKALQRALDRISKFKKYQKHYFYYDDFHSLTSDEMLQLQIKAGTLWGHKGICFSGTGNCKD
ncbi:hypothetical protein H9S87_19005 (plasmid) [Bacillus pumilus]|uniref:hypothetical protein n=1 Tax=Bacillus pumilus TaxID=1408 RepID=UPI00165842F8|nr:hypothetical protein [Bacillus pumilus]QNP18264.1 hypothetical protein H9S87_19005 [Bacillus pumilus]